MKELDKLDKSEVKRLENADNEISGKGTCDVLNTSEVLINKLVNTVKEQREALEELALAQADFQKAVFKKDWKGVKGISPELTRLSEKASEAEECRYGLSLELQKEFSLENESFSLLLSVIKGDIKAVLMKEYYSLRRALIRVKGAITGLENYVDNRMDISKEIIDSLRKDQGIYSAPGRRRQKGAQGFLVNTQL